MKSRLGLLSILVVMGGLISFSGVTTAFAVNNCTFSTSGTLMYLNGDCTTDATILIPDGATLAGAGYTITAKDPSGGNFRGAVVKNGGSTAYVTDLTVTSSLANNCKGGDDRLRGIMFDGASGSITHSTVVGINKGPSGCQEGNAIEIRNAPFDGTHPATKSVEIAHNFIDDYQKTGIVCNGDVKCSIHHNTIGDSATQANLAANTVQIGFGGAGSVKHNTIYGNQWLGNSNYVAAAVLIYSADYVDVSQNNIRGNSDVGIYIYGDYGTFDNNRVFDEGADGPHGDYGIGNWGTGNTITNNKVRGFDIPYDEVIIGQNKGKNKVIPGPQKFE